jgi:hypothetical protein
MAHSISSLDEDQMSRKRRYTIVMLAVVVIVLNNTIQISTEAAAVFASAPMQRVLTGTELVFWIATLYLVWFVAGRRGPAILNDELTTAHRSVALRIGYWCFLAAVALAYAWVRSGRHAFGIVQFEHLLITVASIGAVIPAMVFAFLERRAEQGA